MAMYFRRHDSWLRWAGHGIGNRPSPLRLPAACARRCSSSRAVTDDQLAVLDDWIEAAGKRKLTWTDTLRAEHLSDLYVTLPTTSDLTHPPLALKAFAKVHDLAPGATEEVTLRLDKYAVSYWEERISRWVAEAGEYVVRVGPSSAPEDVALLRPVKLVLKKGFEWNGL